MPDFGGDILRGVRKIEWQEASGYLAATIIPISCLLLILLGGTAMSSDCTAWTAYILCLEPANFDLSFHPYMAALCVAGIAGVSFFERKITHGASLKPSVGALDFSLVGGKDQGVFRAAFLEHSAWKAAENAEVEDVTTMASLVETMEQGQGCNRELVFWLEAQLVRLSGSAAMEQGFHTLRFPAKERESGRVQRRRVLAWRGMVNAIKARDPETAASIARRIVREEGYLSRP